MKIGMPISYAGDFRETMANLRDYESVGLDRIMVPEAYGFDAVPEGLIIPLPDGRERLFEYEDGPSLWSPDPELPGGEVVFSDRPLAWDDWVERWEADAAGKSPRGPLIDGWTFLPGPHGAPGRDDQAAERHPEGV